MKQPRLPPDLRRAAAQLVHERLRAKAWALNAALRRTLLERMSQGESPARLLAELQEAAGRAASQSCAPARSAREGSPPG